MSKDLSIFSKHSLDTSNIKNLAIDLCNRFDINIVYGFLDYDNFWKYDTSKYVKGFNILGKIEANNSDVTVSLTIENYLPKIIFQEIGDAIYDNVFLYTGFRKESFSSLNEIKVFLDSYINRIDYPYEFNYLDESDGIDFVHMVFKSNNLPIALIQKDYLNLKLEFFSSWSGITHMVNDEYEDGRECLNEYRQKHKEFAQLFEDVESCVYTSKGAYILEYEYYLDLINNLIVIENAPIYTFSELFTNNESFLEFQNNINNGILPDVYIDDFKDLENNT